jgi:hypothetical protein
LLLGLPHSIAGDAVAVLAKPRPQGVEPGPTSPRGARRAPPDPWIAAAVGVVALAVYVRSLLPGIGYSGDTAKWQFLGKVGGVPHATGCPLYLIVNRLFVEATPIGSLAWRANLLSALCGAAAVAVLYLLLRSVDVRPPIAAATALTFACTYTFWTQAVVAEVYTLHVLLLVSITACLARWRLGGANVWLLAGLGLFALALGNHLGTMLALPGVAWLVWSDRSRALTPRNAAWAALFAVVGLAQYGYLLWMTDAGAYVENHVRSLRDLFALVTARQFRPQMFAFSPAEVVTERLPLLGRFLWGELAVLVVPAAYGLVRGLGSRHRDIVVQLALLGALASISALEFDVSDVFVFFLPLYLALAVGLGLGAEGIAVWLTRASTRRMVAAGAGALALMPLALGLTNYQRASQRGNRAVAERIERAIRVAGTGAVFVTDNYDDSEYFWYFTLGEGLGESRDLAVVHQATAAEIAAFFAGHRGRLAAVAPPGTPIYTATVHQADTLTHAGLALTEVARDVWRIAPGHAGGRH